MLQKRGIVIALLLGLGLLAVACGSSATATPTATVASGTGDTPTPTATSAQAAPSVREVTVSTQNFRFDPASLDLILGEKVKFTMTNGTSTFHTFTLAMTSGKDQVFVDLALSGGETKSAEFTVPTVTADLYLFCRPHESLGMTGTLHVGGEAAVQNDAQSGLDADY